MQNHHVLLLIDDILTSGYVLGPHCCHKQWRSREWPAN